MCHRLLISCAPSTGLETHNRQAEALRLPNGMMWSLGGGSKTAAAGGDAATFERKAREAMAKGLKNLIEDMPRQIAQRRSISAQVRELRSNYTQHHLRLHLLGPTAPSADSPLALAIIAGMVPDSTRRTRTRIREGMTLVRFNQIRALVRARAATLMIANGFMEEDDAIPTQGTDLVGTARVWLEAESDFFRQEGTPADHLRYVAWQHLRDSRDLPRDGM